MSTAVHRVVGIVEWPERMGSLPELPAILADEILQVDASIPTRIFSWRLPLADRSTPTVLSADIVQLRSDLQDLFDEATHPSPG